MKTISLINFVRGGKSSISRLLAEEYETFILNFDPKRDAKEYNVVETYNVPENSKITKNKNQVIIDTEDEIITVDTMQDYLICDWGGRFDERLSEFESDIFIIPTMDDFESIQETLKCANYIQEHIKKPKIIFVLNQAQCRDKQDKQDFENGFNENLEVNHNLKNYKVITMPYSKLVKKIINNGETQSDIVDNNFKKYANKNILNFVKELKKSIKKELK